MNNVLLHLAVQTPKSLASRDTVAAFGEILSSLHRDFVPGHYGFAEPLKTSFEPSLAVEQLAELYSPSGGSVNFRFRRPLDGQMYFGTTRGQRVVYNGAKVQLDYATVQHRLDEALSLFAALVRTCDAAYACASLTGGNPHVVHVDDPKKNWGSINDVDVPPWNPSGIQSLPGICWINVFGPQYIAFFGESVLQSLPGHQAEFIEDGRWFWLQPTEQPEDMLTASGKALANDIKAHLGHPRAFYGHDPEAPAFNATYETPAFDFSEIRAIPKPA